MDAAKGLSVIVPCFNEERGIAAVLQQLEAVLKTLPIPFEVIVVDDGSVDRSQDAIGGFLAGRANFSMAAHEMNRGYGAALKTGGRAAKYEFIAITDADGTYPVERLTDLVAAMGEADMVVGARTGAQVHIPLARRAGKWILVRLANYLTGRSIPDLNSGMRIARRKMWMQFERYYPDGFSLTTTITLAALTNGYRVRFVPVDYRPRVGRSKIRPVREMLNFIQLILRTVLYFDPLKVFVPLSIVIFLLGTAIGAATLVLQNVYHYGKFMDTATIGLIVASLQLLAIGVLADMICKRLP